jgi:hypothetical protein
MADVSNTNFLGRDRIENKVPQTAGHDDADVRFVSFPSLKGMIGQLPRPFDKPGYNT